MEHIYIYTYIYMYTHNRHDIYIYIYVYNIHCARYAPGRDWGPGRIACPRRSLNKELEYRIPRLHSPVNSRRFPDILSEIPVRTKSASCAFSLKTVFFRLLPQVSVEHRSPYPVLKYTTLSSLLHAAFRGRKTRLLYKGRLRYLFFGCGFPAF